MTKPDVCESLLVAIKDKHGMKDHIIPICGFDVLETNQGECRIILENTTVSADGACNVLIVATDDPTTKEAYGYRSLGHTWLRVGMIGCRLERFPRSSSFVGQVKHFENELGVPER